MHNQPSKAPSTDRERYALDPTRRWKAKNQRGIAYRLSRDLNRAYLVYWDGRWEQAGDSLESAKTYQAELRSRKARGERVVVPAKIKFEDAAERWYADIEGRLRPKTTKRYRSDLDRVLLPRFRSRLISSITPADILELTSELTNKGLAQSTVANAIKPLSGTLGFALFQGWIASNPIQAIPRGRKPSCNVTREHREWTTQEVERVIAEARKLDTRKEARRSYALLTEFLLRTGVRLGEGLGAQFGDIDFDAGVFTVIRQFTDDGRIAEPKTKASTGRRVPLAPGLVQQLASRSLEMDAEAETFLFAAVRGGLPPRHSNYRRRGWEPAVEAAGLIGGPKVTPHDSRHAFASQLADLGLTSGDLAPVLGHSSAGITERIYTHAFNRDEREERVRKAMEQAMTGERG